MRLLSYRRYLAWIGTALACWAFAAPSRKPAGRLAYPFINQAKNQLASHEPGTMEGFYGALEALRTGRGHAANIVHIGDSHVQADYFSGHLRTLLQADSAFGNGGRGLVFPYTAVRTNAPDNLKVTYTGAWEGCRNTARDKTCAWGLAGITATTYSPAATLTLDPATYAPLPYAFTQVRVFCDTEDAAAFEVVADTGGPPPRTSVEDGHILFTLVQPATTLTLRFRRAGGQQTHFTLQGVALDNGRPGVRYHAAGVNGAEVTSVLRMPLLEKHLATLQPDLVIISLGTNDAYHKLDVRAFKRNYGELLQRIRRASPATALLLTTPGDNLRGRRYPNPDNARAAKAIHELAQETGAAVWDFYQVMGGLQSIRKWYAHGLASPDRLHLKQQGYRLQAELLHEALLADYQRWQQPRPGGFAAGAGK